MRSYISIFLTSIFFSTYSLADDPHIHGFNVPDWYDSSCCSNNDCKPVADSDIEFTTTLGQVEARYKPTGNIFYKSQFKTSKDERYHVCINPASNASLCFYDRSGV